MNSVVAKFRRRFAILAAAILLPAVPVSALTFLTPWKVIQTKASHNAPRAQIEPDFLGPGSLLIGMGETRSSGARSRVEANREFRVDSGGEVVSISHGFESLLRDARLSVKIKIIPAHGKHVDKVKFEAGENPQEFSLGRTVLDDLPAGDYRLKIIVDYKNHDGKWDNTTASSGSPHTFLIGSL